MRHLLTGLWSRLTDPRKLLLVAALIAALGLIAGYVEVHQQADRELALRQGPPPAVAIQEFRTDTHLGPADEVVVRAEADFSRSVVLALPGDARQRRAVVAPLFPLSEVGSALVAAASETPASALSAQVARRAPVPTDAPSALGFLYHPLPADTPLPTDGSVTVAASFGEGRWGTVVELNGISTTAGEFGLMAAGAFAALGIGLPDGALVVEPFTAGRVTALTAAEPTRSHVFLFYAAFALSVVALAAALRDGFLTPRAAAPVSGEDETEEVPAAAASHPKFARIPSQREIIEAAQRRAPPPQPHWALVTAQTLLRWSWIVLVALGSLLGMLFRWLRSRLLRPEDEAL